MERGFGGRCELRALHASYAKMSVTISFQDVLQAFYAFSFSTARLEYLVHTQKELSSTYLMFALKYRMTAV